MASPYSRLGAAVGRSLYRPNAPANRRRRRYTPYQAPDRPPTGLYDPALDQSVRAASRGLGDVTADTERENTRAEDDYTIGRNNVTQQRDQTLADILTNQNREGQDYSGATQSLQRSYGILGDTQRQAGNAAGVLDGGFLAQAAAKRQANQGIAQSALDLSHSRSTEDFGTNRTRVAQSADQTLAQLGLSFQRGNEDRSTALSRAQRENNLYGQDVKESEFYGARAAGWVPPTAPKGEHSRHGVTWRDAGHGRVVLPDGRVIPRSRLQELLARRNPISGTGRYGPR